MQLLRRYIIHIITRPQLNKLSLKSRQKRSWWKFTSSVLIICTQLPHTEYQKFIVWFWFCISSNIFLNFFFWLTHHKELCATNIWCSRPSQFSSCAPLNLDMYHPILWVNKMIHLIDASVINNIVKVDVDMPQSFLKFESTDLESC